MPLNKSIQVAVWADDSKEPRIVGECSVDLAEVFRTCEQDGESRMRYRMTVIVPGELMGCKGRLV